MEQGMRKYSQRKKESEEKRLAAMSPEQREKYNRLVVGFWEGRRRRVSLWREIIKRLWGE